MASLKDYFWPTSYIGIKDISQKGKQITKERIKNPNYDGPRCGLGDDEARRSNVEKLKPFIYVYIKRWSILFIICLAFSYVFSFFGVFIIEVVFGLGSLATLVPIIILLYIKKTLLE